MYDHGLDLGLGLNLGAGGKSSVVWSPNTAAIPAKMWLRADNVALGSVSTWTDLTPNGNSPATAGTAPINTAALGPKASQSAMIWTAGTTELSLSSALIGTKNFTMVTVAKFTNVSAAHTIVNPGGNSTGFTMAADVNATGHRDFNANGNVAVTDTTSGATTAYEAWIFESDNSANLTLSVNNVTHTLSPANATAVTPAASLFVGGSSAGSIMLGAIWEIIVFTTKLGAGDRASLVSYLSTETGLF